MIPAAIELATVFLIFFGWFALAFGAAVLIGKAIRGPQDFDADHPHRERVGIPEPSSITSLVEEQQRRANRATLAQRDRWSRSA